MTTRLIYLIVIPLLSLMSGAGVVKGLGLNLLENRVAKAFSAGKIALVTDRSRVPAGGTLRVQLENRSWQDVWYGYQYELARFGDGKWIRVPVRPVFAPRFLVEANMDSPWQAITLPRKAISGRYRIRKWVEPVESRKRPVGVTFRVFVKGSNRSS